MLPASTTSPIVRDSADEDLPVLLAIYTHHVLHGTATFETEPPTLDELRARRGAVVARGLPHLVAEADGDILGYAYAGVYRPRPAYRYTLENSVYVRDGQAGRGVGSLLMAELIERCARGGWRQMVAVIGDSGNTASIALHARHGFRMTGTLQAVGRKFDRWLDTVIMQRELGDGDRSPPSAGTR